MTTLTDYCIYTVIVFPCCLPLGFEASEAHVLDLQILVHAVFGAFAAQPGLFDPPNVASGVDRRPSQLTCQPDIRSVSDGQSFLLCSVSDLMTGSSGPKVSSRVQIMSVETAVRSVGCTKEPSVVDQRALRGAGLRAVTQHEFGVHRSAELLHEHIVDLALHQEAFLNLEFMAPLTAISTSALSNTMKGAWPPSSMDAFFTVSAAIFRSDESGEVLFVQRQQIEPLPEHHAPLPGVKGSVGSVHSQLGLGRAAVRHPGDLLPGGRVQHREHRGCGDPAAVDVALRPEQRSGDIQAEAPLHGGGQAGPQHAERGHNRGESVCGESVCAEVCVQRCAGSGCRLLFYPQVGAETPAAFRRF
ncbi:hypothetical protein F7725_017694 [Dissostichus mawsoni]|uniref:Uncharacterized protein n=1 Tax=Dissostichus mawsoni TaxID=36200 RepID=A0A7J5XQX8_DISMA|nr:hypothetical protein F7725_017694 [Dissostichus mawsoni]